MRSAPHTRQRIGRRRAARRCASSRSSLVKAKPLNLPSRSVSQKNLSESLSTAPKPQNLKTSKPQNLKTSSLTPSLPTRRRFSLLFCHSPLQPHPCSLCPIHHLSQHILRRGHGGGAGRRGGAWAMQSAERSPASSQPAGWSHEYRHPAPASTYDLAGLTCRQDDEKIRKTLARGRAHLPPPSLRLQPYPPNVNTRTRSPAEC